MHCRGMDDSYMHCLPNMWCVDKLRPQYNVVAHRRLFSYRVCMMNHAEPVYVCKSFREFVSTPTNPCFEGKPVRIDIVANFAYSRKAHRPVTVFAVTYADYTEYVEVWG